MSSCVLIVDDDQVVREMLDVVLTVEGFQVVHAATGTEALQANRRHAPDAILMDIMMPDLDGLAATRRLRRNDSTASPPVIAVTALAEDDDVWEVWKAGVDSYISKPFDTDLLLRELRRLIDRQTASPPDAVPQLR